MRGDTIIPKIKFSEKKLAEEVVTDAIDEIESIETILKQYESYKQAREMLHKLLEEIRS